MGELHGLSVHAECCCFLPGDAGVVLCPNPGFHPKVLSESHASQSIELHPFHPPQDGETWFSEQSLLCPVRALMVYLHRTRAHRTTDQLFVCYKPNCLGKPVTRTRLSHWVVDAIRQAYKMAGRPAPAGVRAHSTRGLATSWALWWDTPLSEICTAASWSTPSTFIRFYCMNVAANTSFAERVHGSVQQAVA